MPCHVSASRDLSAPLAATMPRPADEDLQQKEKVQAVVLGDSFSRQFRPITYAMPKVLMPLANVPMIEYTLEFLAAGGVQEVFIFCCAHAAEVERYIRETDLERRLATLAVHVIVSAGPCHSAGDALRELNELQLIKSEFVLIPGDVVANFERARIIAAHKARRELDRAAVLTTLMKRVPAHHRSRRAGENMIVALGGETGRLLMYDDVSKHADGEHKIKLPIDLLQETDRLQLHADLYDTHVDVCTPELLVLLQDNFDWQAHATKAMRDHWRAWFSRWPGAQDLRRDLISGVLGQFEMLGKTM